jgi:hypothetical protein
MRSKLAIRFDNIIVYRESEQFSVQTEVRLSYEMYRLKVVGKAVLPTKDYGRFRKLKTEFCRYARFSQVNSIVLLGIDFEKRPPESKDGHLPGWVSPQPRMLFMKTWKCPNCAAEEAVELIQELADVHEPRVHAIAFHGPPTLEGRMAAHLHHGCAHGTVFVDSRGIRSSIWEE